MHCMHWVQSCNVTYRSRVFVVLVAVWMATVGLARAAEQEAVAASDAEQQRAEMVKPKYVPGQIIVALEGQPSGGAGISVQGDSVLEGHDAALRRLQSRYGVEVGRPVFRRAHRAGGGDGRNRQQKGRRLGPASTGGRSDGSDLRRFYVLQTERDVRAVCAELKTDPEVEIAQPNYIYESCRTPNDPDFPDQYAHQLIEMEAAWDISIS